MFSLDRLPLAVRLWELLADAGVVRGLIGPREVPRLWDRHLLNCAVLADALPAGSAVCDIGSGAGLPGLVLAVRRPDLRLTLVEPLLRRTTFLDEAVEELGLDNVLVRRGRADDLHGEQTFDVVTSRAVAPLERLLGWSMPLVAPEGALVAMKGSSVSGEVEEARGALQRWGCAEPEVLTLGAGTVDPPTTALRVAWSDPATVRWPPARTRDEPRRPARGASARRRGGRRPR
ncbi:16S rRNA (guanine(527)-N(7))-methyltransferase RsmG [Nocardioides sp. P86]|uniref:16S rRNA (guanine(527)-N(7))-methyltransferase RsmG n=1 Tax=Nocardioides sp. P86 TaxID=2939569 RepID=UPI00203B719C|nr:16S rRNA (guanine(527)-N(7))-methyltransferase RsmG [Nocardioides sp. P86]MCM3516453.1 16S rRNA (guanine(527)-N(7))-methyltransferase RsmG [Nocardioides sp. P86]